MQYANTLNKFVSFFWTLQQDLLLKFLTLESESKVSTEKLQEEMQKKVEEQDILQREMDKHEQHVDWLEKQVSLLQTTIEEKEQLILRYKDREKELEDQKAEVFNIRITKQLKYLYLLRKCNECSIWLQVQASLVDAESKLAEAKMQYDLMLESKQSELSRHLKELSLRNDEVPPFTFDL